MRAHSTRTCSVGKRTREFSEVGQKSAIVLVSQRMRVNRGESKYWIWGDMYSSEVRLPGFHVNIFLQMENILLCKKYTFQKQGTHGDGGMQMMSKRSGG